MQGATLAVDPVIHAQGNPEHGFVQNLVAKGWLAEKSLSEEVFVARAVNGSHPEYTYRDVYLSRLLK